MGLTCEVSKRFDKGGALFEVFLCKNARVKLALLQMETMRLCQDKLWVIMTSKYLADLTLVRL